MPDEFGNPTPGELASQEIAERERVRGAAGGLLAPRMGLLGVLPAGQALGAAGMAAGALGGEDPYRGLREWSPLEQEAPPLAMDPAGAARAQATMGEQGLLGPTGGLAQAGWTPPPGGWPTAKGIQFATPPGAQPGAAAGTPGLRLPGAPSVRPITEARQALAGLPGEFAVQTGAAAGRIREAQAGAKAAVGQAAQVQQQAAEEQAGTLRRGLGALRTVKAEEQIKVDVAAAGVQETMGRYRTEMGRLAEMRVDPQRRYQGGAKIGAAIAMALGAYGAALARGPNTAMQIIQAEIDRDIRAQEVAIDQQRGVVGAAQAEVGMARQVFGDATSQRLAAKNAAMEGVKMELSLKAAESASPLVAANAAKAIADIDQQTAQNEMAITNRQQDLALKATQAGVGAAAAEVGARQRGVEITTRQRVAQQAARQAQTKLVARAAAPPTMAFVEPAPGEPRYQPTKDDTKAAQKMSKSYGQAKSEIDKLIAWRIKHGAETLNIEAKRQGRLMLNRAKSVMRELDGTGARLEESELEMMGLEFDVAEIGYVLTALRTLKESITDKTIAGMQPYGYTLRAQQRRARGRRVSK